MWRKITDMHIEILESTPSTMDVARENLASGKIVFSEANAPNMHGVMAYEQTAGRGQRGAEWFSVPRQSLCATFYYRDDYSNIERPQEVSLLAGVAVVEAIQEVIGERAAPPRLGLKWPNDILLHGKKMGGVLIEAALAADGKRVFLIGTGLNLSIPAFPPAIANIAASLAQEGEPYCSCEEMAERIARQLIRLAHIRKQDGFEAILDRWRSYDLTLGRKYLFSEANITRIGFALGVSDEGYLRLQIENGDVATVQTAASLKETFGGQ